MIELAQVSHAYGRRVVLRDVDLRIDGPRTAVIGANGSGKSTLARMINGLVQPSRGTVTVNGLDVAKHGGEVRKKVGFVFSDPDAQIVMPTVAEDLAFSLRRSRLSKPEREARIAEVLDVHGLSGHHDHPAHQLSGGQKQLLALAAVMVTEPEVLVLDEPTTLLDLRNSRELMRRVAGLPAQVVMVTHDLEAVADWPRAVVIDAGRVAFDGPAPDAIGFYRDLMGR